MFRTRRQTAISGKETRISDWATPRYRWTLSYAVLRQGLLLGNFSEYAQLESFFEQVKAGWDSFLYQDADDFSITGQFIAHGDGATKNFQLMRAIGTSPPMAVLAPNLGATVTVYLNGVVQSSLGYSITPWGTNDPAGPGVLKFTVAPGVGLTVTADFSYYFPCRFDDDELDFEKFLSAVYALKKMAFTSIK